MFGDVYCITNKINGKQYVGITTRSIGKRFKEHCEAESCIGNAIKKYGVSSFSVAKIDSAGSREELFIKEIDWIRKLNTFCGGYNLTLGGDGINITPKLEIQLTENQKVFVDFANKENRKSINIDDPTEMVRSVIINIVYFYLMADYLSIKKQSAKMILKLKFEYQKVVFGLNLFDRNELIDIIVKR